MKGKNIPSRETSTHKDPNVRIDLVCFKNRKQFSELSIEWQGMR